MKAKHLAVLLGVSESTVYSWRMGTRQPSGVARRFLEVLQTVEAINPVLYASLLPKDEPRRTKQTEFYQLPHIAQHVPPPVVIPSSPVHRELIPGTIEWWQAEWDDPHSTEFDHLDDDQYAAVKRLIGKHFHSEG